MAMDADVRLLIGVARGGADGDSEALIRSELADIMKSINQNPLKVAVKLSGGESGRKSLGAQVQAQLDKLAASDKFSVQVSKMKLGAGAIADFRKQLNSVINTLNLDKGTSITLTAEGIGEVKSKIKETAAATDEAVRRIAEFNVQIAAIKKQSKNIDTGLNSLSKGATAEEAAQVTALIERYQAWQVEVETLRIEGVSGSDARRDALEAEGATILQNIEQLKQSRAAALEAEEARQRAAQAAAEAAQDSVNAENKKNAALKQGVTLLTQMEKAEQDWTSARGGKSSEAYSSIRQSTEYLREYLSQLERGEISVEEFKQRLASLKASFAESSNTIKNAGENTRTLSERVGGLAAKFTSWLTVSQIVMRLYTALRKMVSAVIDIDTAMTELKKVTDETDATYSKFLDNASVRAKKLGATIADTVNASADFARLGYTLDESAQLADAALVYKNVGDGIEDISQASESIISTMKAFDIQAENSMSIVDKFNEVGNNFAISSEGIGEALRRSASALAAGNNTLDESIALITAANSVVQDPDVVGTTMKTVSMYLRAAKTEAEEAGESTEGMANSVSELREELLALTGGKVDIQIDENTFKSTYQILKELADVWEELTDISQANILEQIGGKRNANVLASLLENFNVAESVVETAANSAGSALKENEKYLESIQGRIATFKATFEELSNNLIGSDLVKFFVDAGTDLLGLLNGITNVINALGGLKTILIAVTATLAIAKGGLIAYKVQLIAVAAVKKIISFFGNLKTALVNVINIIPNAITAWKAYAAGTVSASTAMQASIPVIGLVLAAITALVGALSLYNNGVDEARQKAKDTADTAAELSDDITSLTNKYLELSEAVSTDQNAKDELLSTQDELIDKLSIEKSKLQELIEKYGSYTDAIKAASVAKLQEEERDIRGGLNEYRRDVIDAADEGFFGADNAISISRGASSGYTRSQQIQLYNALKALENAGLISSGSYSSYTDKDGQKYSQGFAFLAGLDDDLSTIDGVLNAYKELGDMLDIVSNEIGSDNVLYDAIYEKYNMLSTSVGAYKDSLLSLNTNLAEQYTLNGLIGKSIPDTKDEFDEYRQSVIDAAVASGEFEGTTEDIETAIDSVLRNQSQFVGFYQESAEAAIAAESAVDRTSKALSNLSSRMQTLQDALKESGSSTGLTTDTINAIKELYQDIDGYDAGKLFEHTSIGIHLNAKALDELESKYQSLTKSDISESLQDLANQYSELTDEILNCSDASKLADLYSQRDAILDQINDTKDLATQYAALTSSYNEWLQAQSRTDEREGYANIGQGYTTVQSLLDQGWVSDSEVTEYLNLLLSADERTKDNIADFEKLKQTIAGTDFSIMDFFQYDDNNNLVSTGLYNFLDAVQQKLGDTFVQIREDGSYAFDFTGEKLQQVADALGMSTEAVQILEKAMLDAGFDVIFDSMFSDIDAVINSSKDALTVLKELKEAGKISADVDFHLDSKDITDVAGQIENAKTLLQEFTEEDGTVNLELEGASEAATILASLIYQKSDLEAPTIMSVVVDTEMAQTEIGNAIGLMQEFKEAVANLEVQTALGVDTTDAQSKVDGLLSELSENQTITGTLEVDTSSVESAVAGINATTPEMLVKAGLDASEVENYDPENLERTVTFRKNSSSVDGYITYLKNLSLNKTVTITYRTIGSPSGGRARADGTAYATGTAMLHGDWRTQDSGVALGGELGQELVVRDGRYFTIGDDSAEFFRYKKGDIIFNAEQTRQILKNGKITNGARRGASYVSGTAFDSGSGGHRPGGSSTSVGVGGGSGSSSSSGSSSNSSNRDEDNSEIIDWIEIAIKRIERAINRLATVATSPFKKLAERLGATNDELANMAYELSVQEAGYNRYMQQANSVGLSSDLQARVQNGTIDINEYDKDTAELIKDYQEWYEKALDCSDAILELKESIAGLYQNKFEDVASDYENQLSLLEHLTNTYNNGLDELEARGYLASTKYYEALREVERQNIEIRKQELADLTKAMSEAINSGAIEEGSEAWYKFQQEINSTKEAIQESETAMIEFGNSIREVKWEHFDYLQKQISAITEEADFLISLMENSDLYTDNGQLTDTGMATMGMHGQNYNVYMAQADKYAQEILALNDEIANDPNNTKLLERKEELLQAQREAILAAEDEKQAIVDMVREGIELELGALQELITSYTDALDSAKDLYDYQKKVKEQTSEIAQLQKQLAAYSGDNSEETRATVQKLQVSLSDAMENLEETQYEHYISEQKKLLDNLYDEYETVLNQRLDDVDALIADMIDEINTNSASISDTITAETDKVGYDLSESMRAIWSNEGGAYSIITRYGDSFTTALTSINNVLNSISANVASMISTSDEAADTTVSSTTPSTPADAPTTPSTPQEPTTPPAQQPTLSDKDYYGVALAIWNGNYGWGSGQTRSQRLKAKGFDVSKMQSIVNQMGRDGYIRSGAWVGKYYGIRDLAPFHYNKYLHGGLVDYTGLAQLDGTPSEPEMVLDSTDTANLIDLKDALRMIANGNSPLSKLFGGDETASRVLEQLAKIESPYIGKTMPVGNYTYSVTIPIERVLDYEDFVNQMRKDGKFEKLIQSMTIDRMVGGSKLSKNRYQW